jgi:diguanylate cyclase (GGDEF)-like protein
MNDDAIHAALVLFRASAGLRPAAVGDAARRVVLAQAMLDRLDDAGLATWHEASTRQGGTLRPPSAGEELQAGGRTGVLACLLADLAGALARSTTAGGARQTASLLRSVQGLEDVATAIEHRYERVDGRGHPQGLGGADIPVAARLVALTDVLVGNSRRAPLDWERRIETMKDSAGAALDPGLAQLAYDAVEDVAVRRAVETATVDVAIAIVSRHGAPSPGLAGVAHLLHQLHDPVELADGLLRQAWPTMHFGSVGLTRLDGREPLGVVLGPEPAIDLAHVFDIAAHSVVRHDGLVAVPVLEPDGTVWGAIWGRPRSAVAAAHAALADLESLELIAATVGAALARTRHEADLTAQARRDQLTGLANRRHLEGELDHIFDGPESDRVDVALIMCDVDGLKTVNDTRGHAAGDDVLRAVARVLERALEGFDGFASRLGGDEFCLVLRSGGIMHAQTVARRATAGVATSVAGDVGLSCGIAYAARAGSPGELLSGADLAQYQVKSRRPGHGRSADGVPGRRRRRDR